MASSREKGRKLPTVLQEYFECAHPECSKNALHARDPVVLPCGHLLCIKCLETRKGRSLIPHEVDCPKCRRWAVIPPGGLRAFHRSWFSTVAFKTLTEAKFHYTPNGPDEKCGLHADRRSTEYCHECHVPVCSECVSTYHQLHRERAEDLEDVADRMDEELLFALQDKIYEVSSNISGTFCSLNHKNLQRTGRKREDLLWNLH